MLPPNEIHEYYNTILSNPKQHSAYICSLENNAVFK